MEYKYLFNLLSSLIEEGTDETIVLDDMIIKLSNKDNVIEFSAELCNADLKERIADFKALIEELEDSDFIEIVEDLAEDIDLNIFSEFLEKDSFTEEEADIIEYLLDYASQVILEYIDNKIVSYTALRDRLTAEE